MPTICLNMIVKNESAVIERCLSSIKDYIDTWVIVDTGSTDGTQEKIKNFLKNIPGELHEREWVNFEHNRNEALQLALDKADYLLFIDADEKWVTLKPLDKGTLIHDFYAVKTKDQNIDHHRVGLIRTNLPWKWVGVLHEEIQCPDQAQGALLDEVINEGFIRDGQRARNQETYKRDINILQEALKKDPTNSRYVFFLAQSYGAAGDLENALIYYDKRSRMPGFAPDTFWSLFVVGCLQQDLKKDRENVIDSYCKAFAFDPSRIEPLHHLATLYQDQGQPELSYILTKIALEMPPSKCLSYLLRHVHEYSLLLKFACAAHAIGQTEEAKESYQTLLQKPFLPQEAATICRHNLQLIDAKSTPNG